MSPTNHPSNTAELERYSATVGVLGDGVAVIDTDGVVRSLNPAGERVLGLREHQIVGQRLLGVPWRTVNEDGSPRAREDHPALIALRTGEAQYDARVGLIRPNGEVTWISVTAVPLESDEGGSQIGVVVSFRDVSRRRQTEVALEESQHKLDLIFNATHDFISLIRVEYPEEGPSPVFRYDAVNDAFCEITSLGRDDVVGRTIEEALPSALAVKRRKLLTDVLERGELHYEGTDTFPHGVFVTDVMLRVAERCDGRATQILAVGRDVTAHATSEAELRASEALFRTMAESMAEGVILTDLEDTALYVNDCVVDLTGYSREEIIGKNVGQLLLTPEGQATITTRTAERTAGESDRYQVELITQDGEHRWVEIGGAPYRDANGTVVGTVGIVTDVTERRSMEQMKEEMVGVVSHELRTPLASLTGSLKLLQREVPKGDAVAERLVSVAVRNSERMLRLVNDLLDFERLEAAAAPLEIQSIDADRLIDQIIDLTRPLADENGIRLATGNTTARVRADFDRISQVLMNLIGNAIKFSPSGGTVTIGVTPDGTNAEFFVRDQGRGIPADRMHTLFRRFSQIHTDDARKKKGAGLGLAISRAIVEQHGGRIWASNDPAGGAVFHFTLPVAT